MICHNLGHPIDGNLHQKRRPEMNYFLTFPVSFLIKMIFFSISIIQNNILDLRNLNEQVKYFPNFSCRFLNPNINYNCSNV